MGTNQIFDQFNQNPPDNEKKPEKGLIYFLGKIKFGGVLIVVLVILACLLGWVVISGLSSVGSDFGWDVMKWARHGRLNPENRTGFEYFLKLVLTTGFIGLGVYFLKKK